MTDKFKIALEDLGSLGSPAADKVAYFVDATLHHTGGNPVAALALLIAAIGALAERCDEHVGVLAAAWVMFDELLRGRGAELAAAIDRMHPHIVAAITDGRFVERSEPKPGWQKRVFAEIDAAASPATPPALDTFDHAGETQDLPKEDL